MNSDVAQMAAMVMADRKMQGWTFDEIEEMRLDFQRMAEKDLNDFCEYLETQCKPIRFRQQMLRDTVALLKAGIAASE